MIDISEITDDLKVFDSNVKKAENLLSIQLGSLDYAPDFGVDLRYFIDEQFQFQNESFQAYLIRRLAENSIDVASVVTAFESLYHQYTFNLSATSSTDGFVR
jgi:hypothetical protein